MKAFFTRQTGRAFTLVEMLVVIAIIGILAALLMPALTTAMKRAKRIWCENNERQLGIAFHLFMHDHNSRFPAAVQIADGGAAEFVQRGYLLGNNPFYFNYRQFQVLSNELNVAKVLICKGEDKRVAADDFASLRSSNISYAIGVQADFSKPDSVLVMDRNLSRTPLTSKTIFRMTDGARFWWSSTMHELKGNALITDGHVEEWNNNSLTKAFKFDPNNPSDLFMPTDRDEP